MSSQAAVLAGSGTVWPEVRIALARASARLRGVGTHAGRRLKARNHQGQCGGQPIRWGATVAREHVLNKPLLAAFVAVATSWVSPGASHATTAASLCTGDPCVISTHATIDADSVLDFGAVALRVGTGKVLTIGTATAPRQVTIRAGSIVLEPGARIEGGGDPAHLVLEATTGGIEMQSTGANKSKINLRSPSAGGLTIDAEGDVLIDGQIDAGAPGAEAQAGLVDIRAGRRFVLSEKLALDATGPAASAGELVVLADGAIQVSDDIFAPGGQERDGGTITLESLQGDVEVAARIDVSGSGAEASGGSVDLLAHQGSVSLTATGELKGTGGTGPMELCGDGASVWIDGALGVVQVGRIDLGGGLGCGGGDLFVATIGGGFTMAAGSVSDLTGAGPSGRGGSVDVLARDGIVLGLIKLNSPMIGGGLTLESGQKITFTDTIDVRSTGGDGFDGAVEVTACEIDLATTASIAGAETNLLQASGAMTLRGSLRASTSNQLRYKTVAPLITGTVTPAPTIIQDSSLADCPDEPSCGTGTLDPGETCDDGNLLGCDGCASTCQKREGVCGDGTIECSEQCDDGNAVDGDGCDADCTAGCGNGAIDPGETCDDGNLVGCDGCASDCQAVEGICGDGNVECAEQCDDGNTGDGDGCDADCTSTGPAEVRFRGLRETSSCLAQWGLQLGNASINPHSGQPDERQTCRDGDLACDVDGRINRRCSIRTRVCLRATAEANGGCSTAAVDYVELRHPRVDVGIDATDLANADRIAEALMALGGKVRSGDRVLQAGPAIQTPETCTTPFDLAIPIRSGSSGRRTINLAARGSDGSVMPRNRIRLSCLGNDAVCGDGIRSAGEDCDDGNTTGCDGCSTDCRVEACGDAVTECSEQCDDGAANATAESRCASSCQLLPSDLRIGGGGLRSADCIHQWSLEADETRLQRDRNGDLSHEIVCHDGDRSCDFDPAIGTCRLRLWSCSGGENLAASCTARDVLARDLTVPHPGTTRPWEALGRHDLLRSLAATPLEMASGESCTPMTELDLPRGQTLRVRLVADAQSDSRRLRDKDKLLLRCED